MEEKKNKGKQRFRLLFFTLAAFFAFVYISGKTGYYQTHLQKSTLLTKEAIVEFEKDVAEGKPVDIKDYIQADLPDYRNVYSKTGYNISNGINLILNDGVAKIVDFLKALFT